MPIRDILQGGADEQGWNEHSRSFVLLSFLEKEQRLDPLMVERFQAHVDEIIDEENGPDDADEDEDDEDEI